MVTGSAPGATSPSQGRPVRRSASSDSAPSAARRAAAAAVKTLETEAIRNIVSALTGSVPFRVPIGITASTRPCRTTTTAAPGTPAESASTRTRAASAAVSTGASSAGRCAQAVLAMAPMSARAPIIGFILTLPRNRI